MKQEISEVIVNAQSGDEEAFNQLYQHFYKTAYRYAYKLTRNKSDAEDVVQESFIMIHNKLKDLKSPYAFTQWMSKIILSNSIRLFRTHQEILIDDESLLRSNQVEEYIDFLPKEAFQKGLDLEALTHMIQCMKPKQQEVLKLIYIEQKTFKEVAQQLNLPEGTIKSRSIQAKKVLKRMVEDYHKTNELLTFREACASGAILTFIIGKTKEIVTYTSANILQAGVVSACVVCGITASISTYQLATHYNSKQSEVNTQVQPQIAHVEEEQDFPNYFQKQVYDNEEITTSKQAFFTLMNWANTKEKLEQKTKEEYFKIQPLISALKDSNSEYHRLLEKNGWYKEYDIAKNK